MSAVIDTESPTNDPATRAAPPRVRALIVVAARPTVLTLALATAIVLVTLVAASSDLTGVFAAVAASWLAVHQVPVTIGTTTLGILPLLPTGALIWLVGRTCAQATTATSTRRDLGWLVGAAVAGPLVCTAVALAVLQDASAVLDVAPPNPLAAFGWVLAIHLVGALGGIATVKWREIVVAPYVPDWACVTLFATVNAARRLLLAGLVATVLSLVVHWSTAFEAFGAVDGFTGVVGLLLLTVLYLPNVAVAAVAVLCGAGVQAGTVSVGLFEVMGGPLPGVPVLAATPTGPAEPWWPAALVVPAMLAVLLGRECGRNAVDRSTAAWAALSAGVALAGGAVVLGAAAGGALGTFGAVHVEVWLWALTVFGWFGGLGALTALVLGKRRERTDEAEEPIATPSDTPIAAIGTPAPAAPLDAELVGEAPAAAAVSEATDIVDAEVVDTEKEAD